MSRTEDNFPFFVYVFHGKVSLSTAIPDNEKRESPLEIACHWIPEAMDNNKLRWDDPLSRLRDIAQFAAY
jgi:hypothetical protein